MSRVGNVDLEKMTKENKAGSNDKERRIFFIKNEDEKIPLNFLKSPQKT